MKVARRQVDFDTVELTITATGKETDPLAPQMGGGTPFNGSYMVDWGDNSAWEVVPQNGDNPTVVTHTYSGQSSWRIHVTGDVRITVHGLSSSVAS